MGNLIEKLKMFKWFKYIRKIGKTKTFKGKYKITINLYNSK